MNHAQKDILITGASGVIGQAIARRLAGPGVTLHVTARKKGKLDSLLRDLASSGTNIQTYILDLAKPDAGRKIVAEFFRKAKSPYGLVCNAGNMGALGQFHETPFKAWAQGITENFLSHAAMIQSFAERFYAKRLKQGAIVVFSGAGVGGNSTFDRMSSYSTSKAALVHLVEALAPELESLGLTINAVAPGPVLSGMTQQALKAGARAGDQKKRALECKSSGGVSPDLAATMVEFLMSAEARAINGRMLSARFDLPSLRSHPERVRKDSNLYRLRRIDNELFEVKPR
jgi:NAD(P)-dependent dehydrogenase (short-subunit alcohol dehydrogenase family)